MLKPNRIEDPFRQDIKGYFPDPAPNTPGSYLVVERGGVASRLSGTGPTTGYPGDVGNQVGYAADPTTASPYGLLLYDVWKLDTNRQHENFYKSGFIARVGQKVTHDRGGEYHTNMIPTGVTNIAAGQPAYLAANGLISNVQATTNGGANKAPQVGTWRSSQDADGYAVIGMNIQS